MDELHEFVANKLEEIREGMSAMSDDGKFFDVHLFTFMARLPGEPESRWMISQEPVPRQNELEKFLKVDLNEI